MLVSLVSSGCSHNLFRGVSVLLSWRATNSLNIRDDYLKSEVTVKWDENGDPHIEASCLSDLYFAQGYTHAQDRLWQMETRRSMARGKLAEKFGAKAIPLDVFTHTLGFEQSAREYLHQLHAGFFFFIYILYFGFWLSFHSNTQILNWQRNLSMFCSRMELESMLVSKASL